MNSKKIENNIEFIINLVKRFLNLDIDESYFKQGIDDMELYLTYLGQQYVIKYDDYRDVMVLCHKNMSGANKKKTSYHREFDSHSYPTLIKKLSTRHNPADLNKQQD